MYAAALLELAEEAGGLDDVALEMAELGDLIAKQPDLGRLMSSRVLSASERASSIERIFKGKVSDVVYRFLQVVNSKGRLEELPAIVEAFSKLVDRKRGIIEVEAQVAVALDGAEAKRVTDELGAALGGTVVLHQVVDPAVIGGMKLRIGDKLIDGSVATQLRKLKQKIVAAGRESARGRVKELITE